MVVFFFSLSFGCAWIRSLDSCSGLLETVRERFQIGRQNGSAWRSPLASGLGDNPDNPDNQQWERGCNKKEDKRDWRRSYLGGSRCWRSWNDGLVGDGHGQVGVVDQRPGTVHFARLKLSIKSHQVRVTEEAAVPHFGRALIIAQCPIYSRSSRSCTPTTTSALTSSSSSSSSAATAAASSSSTDNQRRFPRPVNAGGGFQIHVTFLLVLFVLFIVVLLLVLRPFVLLIRRAKTNDECLRITRKRQINLRGWSAPFRDRNSGPERRMWSRRSSWTRRSSSAPGWWWCGRPSVRGRIALWSGGSPSTGGGWRRRRPRGRVSRRHWPWPTPGTAACTAPPGIRFQLLRRSATLISNKSIESD